MPTEAEAMVEPFRIDVPDELLLDLDERLGRARLPPPAPGPAWQNGTDHGFMHDFVTAWLTSFDWRAQERVLNAYPHFRTQIDGLDIHFVHQRSEGRPGIPLLLIHGWPSTFYELLPLVPLLSAGEYGPSFDLVIPSLPGYCFSGRPAGPWTMRDSAALWHKLMVRLGYVRYGVQGGDFGAGIGTFLAMAEPESVVGLHLNNVELSPCLGSSGPPLSPAEEVFLAQEERWLHEEGGYHAIQSTKPQTLAYGLSDSPVGLAAWILEKWRAWSDRK